MRVMLESARSMHARVGCHVPQKVERRVHRHALRRRPEQAAGSSRSSSRSRSAFSATSSSCSPNRLSHPPQARPRLLPTLRPRRPLGPRRTRAPSRRRRVPLWPRQSRGRGRASRSPRRSHAGARNGQGRPQRPPRPSGRSGGRQAAAAGSSAIEVAAPFLVSLPPEQKGRDGWAVHGRGGAGRRVGVGWCLWT